VDNPISRHNNEANTTNAIAGKLSFLFLKSPIKKINNERTMNKFSNEAKCCKKLLELKKKG
jgi:hypothetical protein